jgi:Zn ribbon nucleic-acid-binding protein
MAMLRRSKCPACNKDGNIQAQEQRIRGIMKLTYGFSCAFCGYQVQAQATEQELAEQIKHDKQKIDSLNRNSRNPV